MLLTAFLVLLAINAGLGLASIRQRDVGAREARRYGTAGERTSELLADLVDQETGVRGFVITGADEFLRPYNRGRAAVEEHTARLRELLAGDPELTEQVERIERLTAQWQERAAEPEIEATRRGDRAAAEQLVASGQGQVRFNRALTEVASLRTSLDAAQDRADALAAGAGQRVNNVLFATFFVGAALLVATARLTDRWISAPLQRISGAVRQVSDGHLEHRIPSPGPVDVARLGTDAEAMRRRIVAELDAARRAEQALRTRGPVIAALREQLQPQHRTLSDGLVTAAAFEPAAGVLAGDWYDLVPLGDEGDRVALCIMDVSGHGAVTGVFALQAKNLLLAALRQRLDPGEALGWLAATLGDTGDLFLTTVLVYLDPVSGHCRYANAGHPPPLVAGGRRLRQLNPTGPLLGPMPGTWLTETTDLAPGEVLVAYTDGVTEARNDRRAEFGTERLEPLVRGHAVLGPQALVDACVDAVRDFSNGRIADDLTLLAVSRHA